MWSMSACLGEVKTNSKIYAMDIYNEHLVAGLADKTIKYVNLNTNDMKVIRPDNLDHNIRSISVTVDSGYNAPPLVSVGDVVGKVMIVNIMSDKTENNVKLHRIDKKCYATNKVGFVPDKTNIVVSGGSDGKFVIFNRNRRLNVYSNSFNSPISDLRVTKDCIVFATGYDWSKGYQSNVSPIEIKFIDSSKLKLE
ncbi:NPP17 [Hepatospora eriocheir]|uniref:NPP17 n=1 Tax=Hepatospora eriocheir TaxID=1081669 RepID=A0A1X0QD90_9MICR|nr:NPP17 [Hepatospora eriocheir]